MTVTEPLLSIRDLTVDYRNPLRQGRAVNGLSFDIGRGEALALVGESGCGKSTTALSILRLLPSETEISGSISLEGRDLVRATDREIEALRGKHVGMIFQEPLTSLNPVYRIGWQIAEVIRRHLGVSARDARSRALELLDLVALPDAKRRIDAYPHELSGGQRQRVMIAMAIALRPRLLIADEPTTALDASVQDQIMSLIDDLRRELDMAVLLISHDIPVVSRCTDRVIVMHHGERMEELPSADIFDRAHHSYTRGLIGASLRTGDGRHYSTHALAEIAARQGGAECEWRFDLRVPAVPKAAAIPLSTRPALTVENLSIDYPARHGTTRAVSDISFTIERGRTLGLVGESGSGKSSVSRAIVGLVRPAAGRILLGETRLDGLSMREMRPLRRRVQMIFQDPYASLNPRQEIGTALSNLLSANGVDSAIDRERRIREALDQVALPLATLTRKPHEFSGGQRQRIAIARALLLRPELVICDEPVSALDVSVQAQILNLLSSLKCALGLTYLFISHDLAVVQYFSDDVVVMRQGKVVEHAGVNELWNNPQHDYTRMLLRAAE